MTLAANKVVTGSSVATWLPAVIIAGVALLFTVASFWWLNVRRGRLKTFEPHTFSAVITKDQVRFLFPLVIYNTGAAPIVVQNFRMRFRDESGSKALPWMTTRRQVTPGKNDWEFPAVFSVAGRTAYQTFVEFKAPSLGFALKARDYAIAIESKLGHKRKWRTTLKFTLHVGRIIEPDRYITYENTPDDLSEEQRKDVQTGIDVALTGVGMMISDSADLPTINKRER